MASLAWQPGWFMPTPGDALLMVCLGISTGLGHYLLIEAFLRMGPAVAAPFTYTHLVWAILLGWLAFGEAPDAGTLTGIAVIAASGIHIARQQEKR